MNFKFPNKRLAARLMAVTAITLATASCSWLESLDKDPTADWSADKLYTEARAALEESNWTDAKDYYTKLEARYPFGTYAQQAQIELIYANWKDGDAAQAVDLRRNLKNKDLKLADKTGAFYTAYRAKVPYVKADRIFTDDIRAGVDLLKNYRF